MIFFDGIEVKITGGDFKGLMDIMEIRNKSEFKVLKEDIKADGGLIEILHAVNGANSTHAQELGITRDEFMKYEILRKQGSTNMWNVSKVEVITGLSKKKIEVIMNKYAELKKRYIKK